MTSSIKVFFSQKRNGSSFDTSNTLDVFSYGMLPVDRDAFFASGVGDTFKMALVRRGKFDC